MIFEKLYIILNMTIAKKEKRHVLINAIKMIEDKSQKKII